MPPVDPAGLRDIQFDVVGELEKSLAADRPRALAAITMGGGKTRLAVAEAYRLLRFAGATRILFLVDRVSLGDQAAKEFRSYLYPDGRRFDDEYNVQVLKHADSPRKACTRSPSRQSTSPSPLASSGRRARTRQCVGASFGLRSGARLLAEAVEHEALAVSSMLLRHG